MRRSPTITWGSAVVVAFFATLLAQPLHAQTARIEAGGSVGISPSISHNGRYVVYELAVGSLWVLDRHAGLKERVDLNSAGVPGNNSSVCGSISDDGRFVAFASYATNLVPSDGNGFPDVFVRDRVAGLTSRVSVAPDGSASNGGSYCSITISGNGRWVAFSSQASNIVPGDGNGAGTDIFVRDRLTNTTAVASVSSSGQWVSGDGGAWPRLSANGRVVAWSTLQASALTGAPAASGWHVVAHDFDTGQTTLMTRSTAGTPGGSSGDSRTPGLSADGRFVTFCSGSTTLVANDLNNFIDVFVHDRQLSETTRVSVSTTGVEANNDSGCYFSISADGRFVGFTSNATNLVTGDGNGAVDAFVRDRQTSTTVRASLRQDEAEPTGCSSNVHTSVVLSGSGLDTLLYSVFALDGGPQGCASTGLTELFVRRVRPSAARDFDDDTRADVTVFRPSNSTFFTRFPATAGGAASSWGLAGDIPAVADFDGDGRADYAVFRPSTGVWYWLHSWTNGSSYGQYPWGAPGDVPVAGDYDRDGKADPAVFRPSTGTWFARLSGSNFTTNLIVQFGANGDVPVPADYDGDRKMDIAVYRPSIGVWFILHSSTGAVVIRQWGISTDVTVPGDYDGDGRADLAVYRPSEGMWYLAKSTTDFVTYDAIQWGVGADVPVPGDYNGDGRMDPAVYRPGNATWWIYNQFALFWGSTGDVPIGGR